MKLIFEFLKEAFLVSELLHLFSIQVPKFCPNDKNSDRYDRPSIAAIKSVSMLVIIDSKQ